MNLHDYIAQQILPCYAHFDAAHRLDHVESVMTVSYTHLTLPTILRV